MNLAFEAKIGGRGRKRDSVLPGPRFRNELLFPEMLSPSLARLTRF
ncbi:MAG: hypothetical protein WD490_07655 [Opitutales bacterium]